MLNTTEAAKFLTVTKASLEAWRFKGIGPAYIKVGNAVRYQQSDLEEFLRKGRREPIGGNGRI